MNCKATLQNTTVSLIQVHQQLSAVSFIPSLKLNTDSPVSSYYKQHLLPFMSSCGPKDDLQPQELVSSFWWHPQL